MKLGYKSTTQTTTKSKSKPTNRTNDFAKTAAEARRLLALKAAEKKKAAANNTVVKNVKNVEGTGKKTPAKAMTRKQ